ncbi:hypothetical protein GWI33_005876 [Rhynchophorus ferrugineus]|uniref:Uncharacterized protein n=1 Tax=Rhynchophorus ferrugineus TaxID=354439 RepID=A0A834ME37_RHYFE|nr:hypothetical protein GWI33_005876 [Rhynchophorus ferrugineus]
MQIANPARNSYTARRRRRDDGGAERFPIDIHGCVPQENYDCAEQNSSTIKERAPSVIYGSFMPALVRNNVRLSVILKQCEWGGRRRKKRYGDLCAAEAEAEPEFMRRAC